MTIVALVELDEHDVPALHARLALLAAMVDGARPTGDGRDAFKRTLSCLDGTSGVESSIRISTTANGPIRIEGGETPSSLPVSLLEPAGIHKGPFSPAGIDEAEASLSRWRDAISLPMHRRLDPTGPSVLHTMRATRTVAALLVANGIGTEGLRATVMLPGARQSGSVTVDGADPLTADASAALRATMPRTIQIARGGSPASYVLRQSSPSITVPLPYLGTVEAMRIVSDLPPELRHPESISDILRKRQ